MLSEVYIAFLESKVDVCLSFILINNIGYNLGDTKYNLTSHRHVNVEVCIRNFQSLLVWLANPCCRSLLMKIHVYSTLVEFTCGLYCNYVQKIFITDSGRERMICRDHQLNNASNLKASVTITCVLVLGNPSTVSSRQFHS